MEPTHEARAKDFAKDLLLADHRYFTDAFWKSEQQGETRINIFLAVATLTSGAVGKIAFSSDTRPEVGVLVTIVAATALLFIGYLTLRRVVKRNRSTDEYLRHIDQIRDIFKEKLAGEGVLDDYDPYPEAQRATRKTRSWGGLVHQMAAMNALIFAGAIATLIYIRLPPNSTELGTEPSEFFGVFLLVAYWVQLLLVRKWADR